MAAIEDAAARDTAVDAARLAPSVGMDFEVADPGIALQVRSPAAALVDLVECLSRLEQIVAQFVAGKR